MNPQELQPGPELDKLAREAFPEVDAHGLVLHPSRYLTDAFLVLTALRKRGWTCNIELPSKRTWVIVTLWIPDVIDRWCQAKSDKSMPLASAVPLTICRVALRAAEQEKQT